MDLNLNAVAAAQLAFDNALFRYGPKPTTAQRIMAFHYALETYEGQRERPQRMTIVTRRDRRMHKNRRTTDSLVVAILQPEEQAAQVERVYNAVPQDKREAAGLTYEHVRLSLEALR